MTKIGFLNERSCASAHCPLGTHGFAHLFLGTRFCERQRTAHLRPFDDFDMKFSKLTSVLLGVLLLLGSFAVPVMASDADSSDALAADVTAAAVFTLSERASAYAANLTDGSAATYLQFKATETLQIAPTVLADVSPDSPVMSEEIFGPVLPVLAYESLDEAVAFVNARPKPLALYLFTTDKAAERRVLRDCSFGGGCINDTIIHLATSDMGFGGVGESGMGSYHGKLSFDTFTHYKSIVKKSNRLDLPVRYQPYTKEKERMLRRVLK